MSDFPTTPVEVRVQDRWYQGTLLACEVTEDGATCAAVVTYPVSHDLRIGRFPAEFMRDLTGTPGCPADHVDETCGVSRGTGTDVVQVHTYPAMAAPDVEVLVDGVWQVGVLHEWRQLADLTWWADVLWSPGPGHSSRLDRVPADRVRPA